MKKYSVLFTVILLFLISTRTTAQIEEEIFKVVEEMPRFPGCEDLDEEISEIHDCSNAKMIDYIYSNLEYPKEAKSLGVEGTVVAQFIVMEDGRVNEIRILRDLGGGTAEAATKVIESFNNLDGKWRAGHQNGKAVKVLYTLPIKFNIDNKSSNRMSKFQYRGPALEIDELDVKPKFGKCSKSKDNSEKAYKCTLQELMSFIDENVQYPELSFKKKQEEKVKVTYTISSSGKVVNVKAYGNYPLLTSEVENLILFMNDSDKSWMPGRKNGKAVNTKMVSYVNFDLSEWE